MYKFNESKLTTHLFESFKELYKKRKLKVKFFLHLFHDCYIPKNDCSIPAHDFSYVKTK